MMNVTPLDFEKPIIELAKKLEDLKRHLRGQEINSRSGGAADLRRISRRPKTRFTPASIPGSVCKSPAIHNGPMPWIICGSASATSWSCMGTALFGGRRARCIAGLATIGEHPLRGGRAPEGARHQGEHPAATSAARTRKATGRRCGSCGSRKNSGLPVVSAHRHAGGLSRRRRGGAPYCGSHRRQPARDDAAAHAHRRHSHRGGWLGWGAWASAWPTAF